MTKIGRKQKELFAMYYSKGHSSREIGTIMNISRMTVLRYTACLPHPNMKKQAGAPKKLTARLENKIVRNFETGRLRNCTDAKKHLSGTFGQEVSIETIRLLLVKSGMKSYVKTKKPRLLPHHKKGKQAFVKYINTLPETI